MNDQMDQPRIQRFPVTSEAEAIYKAIQRDRVVVINNFLSSQQVAKLNDELDPYLARVQSRAKTTESATQGTSYPWKLQDSSLADGKLVY
ncbi:hypothetical protein GGR51DRAFT_524918 [Nemania sp. FL0031]|nr:hypothetical protein GGR51DRAFT_524918 [Nemania sp. FL0031]